MRFKPWTNFLNYVLQVSKTSSVLLAIIILASFSRNRTVFAGVKCWLCVYAEKAPAGGNLSDPNCRNPNKTVISDTLKLVDCATFPKRFDTADASSEINWSSCIKNTFTTEKYGVFIVRGCMDYTPYKREDVMGRCVRDYTSLPTVDPFTNFTGTINDYMVQHMIDYIWSESPLQELSYTAGTKCVCDSDECNSEKGIKEFKEVILRGTASQRQPPQPSYFLTISITVIIYVVYLTLTTCFGRIIN